MKKKKRFYSKEFKENAVNLSYQRENIKELAEELGIRVERIYKWRSAHNSKSAVHSASGATSGMHSSAEIKKLKKELKDAQIELEILKKAIHIFSRSDGKNISL